MPITGGYWLTGCLNEKMVYKIILAKNAETLQILGASDIKNFDIRASFCIARHIVKTGFADFKPVNWKILIN